MKEEKEDKTEKKSLPKCGIVMPISAIDGCSAEHWADVQLIIKEAISQAKFEPNLVSDADESGIIQKRIISNLYHNEIVVCDVSGKNPNVMFELGMRLAFDKPTIIIKDDATDYSFDTSIIEHLSYPRDLRFNKIMTFKEALRKKIHATFEKATNDKNYTTFLKHFGEYKVAEITEKIVSSDKFILNALQELKDEISIIRRNQSPSQHIGTIVPQFLFKGDSKKILKNEIDHWMKYKGIKSYNDISHGLPKELYENLKTLPGLRKNFPFSEMLYEGMHVLLLELKSQNKESSFANQIEMGS